jgi:hypothetical protein
MADASASWVRTGRPASLALSQTGWSLDCARRRSVCLDVGSAACARPSPPRLHWDLSPVARRSATKSYELLFRVLDASLSCAGPLDLGADAAKQRFRTGGTRWRQLSSEGTRGISRNCGMLMSWNSSCLSGMLLRFTRSTQLVVSRLASSPHRTACTEKLSIPEYADPPSSSFHFPLPYLGIPAALVVPRAGWRRPHPSHRERTITAV